MTDQQERASVEAAQRDPARFAELYELHFYRVYAFLIQRTGDRHHAEDLTAEVFRQALAALPRFEWRGVPFSAWLLKIAANAVRDHWSHQSREAGDPAELPEARDSQEIERHAAVFQLVERLPEAQRRVIELRFVEQKSIREAATEMGRSEGAIKQLQLRAIENLRAELEGIR